MLIYLLILVFSIILHEFGHLITALFFKVKVHAFSLGFGKVLLHTKWKGIDWRLSLVPFGGYCDIEEALDKPNSLSNLDYWKQVIILMAGVFLNLVLALLCYIISNKSIIDGFLFDMNFIYLFMTKSPELYYLFPTDLELYLFYGSFLNITMFLFNILPIPALDGGYLWILLFKNKKTEKFYNRLIKIFFILLLVVQVFLIAWWWVA